MVRSATSYPEDRYDLPMPPFPRLNESVTQTLALDRKHILDALGGSIWPTSQPTFNYRLRGTDTLDWSDQSIWVEIKWILSLLEQYPGTKSFVARITQYGTLLDIIKSQRFLYQIEEIYSLRNAETVRGFLHTYPQLIEVLLEAHVYLQRYFGPDPQVTLEVVSDPEVEAIEELFAYILASLPVDEALTRLDKLDEEWFLDQLDRTGGRLNFNLEFV